MYLYIWWNHVFQWWDSARCKIAKAEGHYCLPFPIHMNLNIVAVPYFRYKIIRESRATKHPVDGKEKLSPMRWSHWAYGWRPSAKALFYGEIWEGKRSALKPKKRFKDTMKYYLKQSGLSVDQWEEMASDRSKWRKLIHESIESFENSRMQYSAYKRLIRKGEQDPAPGPQS